MKPSDRPWVVFVSTATLTWLAACGPGVAGDGTEGASGDSTGASTGATTAPNTTMPNTTTPDPSVGTGDVTGEPGTTTAPETTGPADSTTGGGSDGCCDVHSSPGCNEDVVVECVCAQEASCCAFEWAQNCVDIAMADCMATCEVPPDTTTGEPGTTTGEPMGDCVDLIQFEMQPSEATYDGAWQLGMSMVGEGEISVNQFGGEGTFTYSPDIPCNDTWYIWARAFDNGSQDSYFATLDGEPMPEAIFEGDCMPGGMGYRWSVLNWRDQAAMACDYVENPWAPDWTAGVHDIVFSFREAQAMGRILITNDQDYVPM